MTTPTTRKSYKLGYQINIFQEQIHCNCSFVGGKKDNGEDKEDDYGDTGKKIRLRGNP